MDNFLFAGGKLRSTIAKINLRYLRYNLNYIKQYASNAKIMAVVKANAYGHGIVDLSKFLNTEGVDFFGVAFTDEGAILRESGIKDHILVLVPDANGDAENICNYELDVAVSSLDFCNKLSEFAKKQNKIIETHLYIDTGMSRDGIFPDESVDFMTKFSQFSNLKMTGICSHFASSDSDIDFSLFQLKKFKDCLSNLNLAGYNFKYIHMANSSAIFEFPDAHFNMVRPGLSLYGYSYKNKNNISKYLKPILSLSTKVISTRTIKKGDSVGYNRTFISDKETKIATIPIGYGDGYSRHLTNKSQCLIKGKTYNLVGTVCMDESMIDIGFDDINIGDEVVLIGSQENSFIGADLLAKQSGTITYEIITSLSARVPRFYVETD